MGSQNSLVWPTVTPIFRLTLYIPCVDFVWTLCTIGLSCVLSDAVIKAHKDIDTDSRKHQNKYYDNKKYLQRRKKIDYSLRADSMENMTL